MEEKSSGAQGTGSDGHGIEGAHKGVARELAAVLVHTALSKYLRGLQWELTDARHVAEVAEQVADPVEAGQAHASDSIEELHRVLEADREKTAAAVEELHMLG